ERQGSTNSQEIFNPFWGLVPAMGEQTVIAHADSQAARDPPQENRDKESLPGKEPECRNSGNMECGHKSRSYPVNFVVVASTFERFDLQGSVSVDLAIGLSVTVTAGLRS